MTEATGASADYAPDSIQIISKVASAAGEDLTLYACWTANQYAVAYYKDSSAAEASDSQSLYYDQEGTINYSVSREHYTFSGWATEPNGSVVYQNGDQIKNLTDTANGTVKLYAIWTPVSYGIAIELYGGSFANGVAANESYTIESGDYTLPVPSKSGYTFDGWTGSNGETPQITVTIKQGTGGNLSYSANWTANTYKITYDANGGSLQCDRVQEVAYNTAPAAVADPVRIGYQFVRWENLPSLMPAEDVTASAVWQIEQYGLTVDMKGGGFAEGTEIPDNYTVETETYTLPVPLRTGYAFTGWTGTDLTEATEIVSISKGSVGDRSYVAHWKAKTYDVAFYMEHETDAAVYWTQSVAFDSIIPFPDAPTKTGYTFKGWTTADGTSVSAGTTLTTEGLELYADWNINVIQVKLDAGSDVAYGDYRLEYGGKYPTLPVPERDGYRFMGWFYGNTEIKSGDTVACTEESQTLVAKWKQYYTVTLNWNYAGTTADTEPAYDGQVYHVDENTQREEYTREGYAFIGWFTEPEGGAQVNGENPYKIEGDLALYAHWQATQYTISYSYDDDVAMPAEIAAGYSDLMLPVVLPVPEKTGYEFTGWQAGTQTPIFEIPEGTYGDCFYHATWRVKQYKVTCEAGTGSFADGTRIKEAQFAYGTEITEPDDLTRKGYQHIGWAPALPDKMPASDLKVTAQWKAAQYVVTLNYCDDSTEASTITATYHETYGNLPTPNRKGYTFVGWFTAKAGGSQITENTVVECTENIMLYARYEQVEGDYSVVNEYLTKIEKAGDLSVYSDESVAAIQAAVEAVVFGLGSEDQDQIDQMAAALRKAWNNREFCRVTVTFAPCGGSCNEVTLEYRYGEPYANLPGVTREGYTFQGWYTAEKGGTQVNENVLMKERTDHTLYAQWKWVGADYSDVYAALDRIPADLNTYSEETRNRLQNAVDAVEYGLGAEKQSKVDSWAEAINKAVAGLVKKTMTVRFDANGGQVSPVSKTVSHGDTLLMPVPTRSGYAFAGWFNAKSGGREYTEQSAITDHITLYARWTFVSADYGAVNTAISQIPVNLGLYTKKSAAAVTEAKNAVKWGLSSAEQATVNEFATAIRKAVNGLVRTMPFADVKEGAWFHDTISTLYYSGIVKGMSETTYAPELSTNRAQMAVLLHRICGEPEAAGNNPFTDVPKGSYYYDAVCWAYEKGVIKGLTEITYGPEEPITREQFATMLYRLFGSPAVGGSLGSFPDGRAVSDWARAGVIWSVQMGIIRGDDTGRLSPTENATRAEVATMLLRYMNLVS